MGKNGQIGYPAIAKAQRLSAERLRARDLLAQEPPPPSSSSSSEQRPAPEEQVEFRERTEQGGAHLHQGRRQQRKTGKTTLFDKRRHADNSGTTVTGTGGVRLSPRRRVPPSSSPSSSNQQAVARDLSGRSRSTSPLPPRHRSSGDSGSSSAAAAAAATAATAATAAAVAEKRTFADVEQIFCGVRGEAVALDRFISLEVTPAAQQAFDAAISEYAKAFDLLEGLPTALSKSVDADQKKKQNVPPRPGVPQAVKSNNSSANDNNSDRATPVPSAAVANDDVVSTNGATSTAAVAAAAAVSSDATTAGANTSSVNKKLVACGTTANPAEGWPRAEDAPVVTAIPPPAFSDRANLPARGSRGTKTGRPPIVDLIGRSGGGGGSGGGDSDSASASARRRSPPRPHGTKGQTGMTARYHQREREGGVEKTAGSRRQGGTVKESSGHGRVGHGAAVAGGRVGDATRKSEFDEREDDEEEEDDGEEDEGWGEPLPRGVLATDISSKIVGLSSLIRSKAAKAENDTARKR